MKKTPPMLYAEQCLDDPPLVIRSRCVLEEGKKSMAYTTLSHELIAGNIRFCCRHERLLTPSSADVCRSVSRLNSRMQIDIEVVYNKNYARARLKY